MRVVLKWVNKYSREEGYVKSVSAKSGHFTNTTEQSDAKVYKSENTVNKELKTLEEIGETVNNEFYTVEV